MTLRVISVCDEIMGQYYMFSFTGFSTFSTLKIYHKKRKAMKFLLGKCFSPCR